MRAVPAAADRTNSYRVWICQPLVPGFMEDLAFILGFYDRVYGCTVRGSVVAVSIEYDTMHALPECRGGSLN